MGFSRYFLISLLMLIFFSSMNLYAHTDLVLNPSANQFLPSDLIPLVLDESLAREMNRNGDYDYFFLFPNGNAVNYLKGLRKTFSWRGLDYIENLSAYEENAKYENGRLIAESFNFHIERTVRQGRSGFSFSYSAMINSIFQLAPGENLDEVREGLAKIVRTFDGFVETGDYEFKRHRDQILINLSRWGSGDLLNVGVIHEGRLPTLEEVLTDRVPSLVTLHNKLNPRRAISEDLVKASQWVALHSNKREFPGAKVKRYSEQNSTEAMCFVFL